MGAIGSFGGDQQVTGWLWLWLWFGLWLWLWLWERSVETWHHDFITGLFIFFLLAPEQGHSNHYVYIVFRALGHKNIGFYTV